MSGKSLLGEAAINWISEGQMSFSGLFPCGVYFLQDAFPRACGVLWCMQGVIYSPGQVNCGLKSFSSSLIRFYTFWGVFSMKQQCQGTSLRIGLRMAQVYLCPGTLSLEGLLWEPWVPEHLQCCCWSCAGGSQDVPRVFHVLRSVTGAS